MWITCEAILSIRSFYLHLTAGCYCSHTYRFIIKYVTGHCFWPPNPSWANISFATTQTCPFKIYIIWTIMMQLWNSLFIIVQAWASVSSETHGAGPAHNSTFFIGVKRHWIQVFKASRNKTKQNRWRGRAVALRGLLRTANMPTSC